MSDPVHPEGIYACNGCGRTYPEYINGCLGEHSAPRSVRLIVPEQRAASCPGSGRVYLFLREPLSVVCPRCMYRLHPTRTARIEWKLPDHDREGRQLATEEKT